MSFNPKETRPLTSSFFFPLSKLTTLPEQSESSFRPCMTTPFAIEVIEESVEKLHQVSPSQKRERLLDGARVAATPAFFRDLLDITNKYGFPEPMRWSTPSEKTQLLFTGRSYDKVSFNTPSRTATVDLTDTSLNLKVGADKAWIKMFEGRLKNLIKADNSEQLRKELRLLLLDFYFENRERKKFNETFTGLLTDLRESSLTFIQKKYFPQNGRVRTRSSSLEALDLISSSSSSKTAGAISAGEGYSAFTKVASSTKAIPSIAVPAEATLPAFITTFIQIFNNETPINIEPIIENEQQEIINDILENQCSNRVVKKDESLRLLVHLKNESRMKKGKSFNAHVMTTKNLAPFLNKMAKSDDFEDNKRIQIINRSVAHHYTALDLELKNNAWKCFIMDASNSMELGNIRNQLLEAKVKNIVEAFTPHCTEFQKELQADQHNCWVFAFDHILQSSKIDIFKLLEEKTNFTESSFTHISWFDLPRKFIRNAQSTKLLQAYASLNPEEWSEPYKNFSSFGEYMTSKVQEVDIKGTRKPVNANTVLRAELYRGKIRSAIKNLSPAEISDIVSAQPF